MIKYIIAMIILISAVGLAQDQKEAPQKEINLKTPSDSVKHQAPLPKIDLPEFVITGNEKIDLDLKSKEEEDEDHIYTPGKPTPGTRNLIAEGGLSPKQTKQFVNTPAGLNGKVFAGFGFYQTPQFDGWFGQHNQSNSYIVNGYYSSSAGHVTNADWWKGGFGAKGHFVMPDSSSFLPYAQLNGTIDYDRDSYKAYGSRSPLRVRDLNSFGMSFGIGSRYALPYRTMSGFDYTGTVGFKTYSAADSGSSDENDFYFNGTATTRLFGSAFRAQIEYRTTGYTLKIPSIQSGQWFILKADGVTLLDPSFQLSYGLGQFLYKGNIGKASGRLYPQVELKYFMIESATMFAGFSPAVQRTTLSSLIEQNRYIDFNAFVVPTDVRSNIYAGIEFNPTDELTAKAKYSYKSIYNYPTFLDTGGAKVWEVTYLSGVNSSTFDLSLLYRLTSQQNITAFVTTQSVKQKDSSGTMPYLPKYSFGTVYHQFFDFGLHVEGLAEYIASRFSNFTNTRSNAGYVYASVKADMELFTQFRGYVEIQNVANQQYYIWEGYRERTLFLTLGVSYNW